MATNEENMRQQDGDEPGGAARDRLIRARDDVVVTSAQNPTTGERTYYLKLTGTGEIFEFGATEYEIWKGFEGGASLKDAERAAEDRFGGGFRDKLRSFVGDLAYRGLLGGDLPPDLVQDYRAEAQQRWRPFLIDPPGERRQPHTPFRLVLGDPNAFFGWLARWFGFLKYLRWPLAFGAVLSILVIFKHAQFFAYDYHATILRWGRIPHAVLTLFTINLSRVLAQGAVSRYYGARVRYISIDLVYGVWPRFHEDKKGILLLERTPQLWSHSTPFFVRLAYFDIGTLGWWWFRGDGAMLYTYLLLLSQAALIDFVTATLPLFRNETYFWFCAFNRDPVLQDRGKAALRSMFFLPKGLPAHLSAVEKLALSLYGLSMLIALVAVLLTLVTFMVGLTGAYAGLGFAICVIMVTLGFAKVTMIRNLKRRLLAAKEQRRADQRAFRRRPATPVLAQAHEE
jgi:hypothetical protein